MADGTITIDTEIDKKRLKIGLRDIEASAKRMASTVGGVGEKSKIAIQKQVDAISRLNHQYEQQKKKVDELKEKVKDLSEVKIETEEYKKVKQELTELDLEFEKVEGKQREWLEMGFTMDSGPLKELDRELDKIWADMERLQSKQKEMENSGRAYLKPEKTKEYINAVEKQRIEEKKLQDMNNRLNTSFLSLEQKVRECGKEALRSSTKLQSLVKAVQNFSSKAVTSGINGFKKRLNSINRAIEKLLKNFLKLSSGAITGGLKRLANGIFAIQKSANKTTMSLGRMLGTSLLLAGAFRAITGIINGIGTGFNNLVQCSEHVNASVSALYSSLTRLQNAFATAFAPILTVAQPYLTRLMDLLADAATYAGMFFARLTGQDYFLKAKKVQENYAENLGQTADSTKDVADATKDAAKELKGYLSPLDEISKYGENDYLSDNINTPSGGGIGTGLEPSDMFEKVPIEDSIKRMADKLKQFIKSEDWEGLGAYIADGINRGLQKIYNVINWDNVGPKIIPFINAFTRTFNSLADNIDWNLLGRTLGTGVNTIVNTLNLLITGIDWKNLGKKFAEGITGIVYEVDWNNLGELMGNRFMILWDVLNGMIHNLPYEDIGRAASDLLNGVFRQISFADVGDTLATGLNGAFSSLYHFAVNFDWKQMVDNVAGGMNTFFAEFDWKGNGEKLNVFIENLLNVLLEIAETTDWNAFGKGVGEFLGEIDWSGHLKKVIQIIKEALNSLFGSLEESGTAGEIAAFLGKAFLAVKIADITGISSLVKVLVGAIGKKLVSAENITSVAGKLKELFGSGTKEAGDSLEGLGRAAGIAANGGFKKLLAAIGSSGAGIGLIAVLPLATSLLAGFVEKLQGGNGKLSEMGAAIDDMAGKLQNMGAISSQQADEVYKIVDSCEDAGMSAEEMTNTVMTKFAEWGLSTQNVNAVLQDNDYWTTKTKESVDLLTQGAEQLGAGMSKTAGEIDLSSVSMKEAMGGMRDALYELSLSSDEFGGSYQGILMSMDDTLASSATAQEALNLLTGQLEAAGIPADEFIVKLSEKFPQAAQAVKTSVDTNITGSMQTVENKTKTAGDTVEKETAEMKKAAEKNLPGVSEAVDASFSDVDETTVTKWGSSSAEVKKNLDHMKQTAAMKLAEMTKTVQSYSQSMYNIMTKKWEYMAERVGQIITEMNSKQINPKLGSAVNIVQAKWQQAAVKTEHMWDRMSRTVANSISGMTNRIRNEMNSMISTINYGISNINYSISGIEAAMNFGPWEVPTVTGSRIIGFHASFPRVPNVPYLAKGAVIPPRSEFLAVLGDQKQGNNIEAPESLLRKIVREETGGTAGGNYRFTVQLNRRTIYDEVIEEAKLRRDQSGFNPFLLT